MQHTNTGTTVQRRHQEQEAMGEAEAVTATTGAYIGQGWPGARYHGERSPRGCDGLPAPCCQWVGGAGGRRQGTER